MARLVCMCVCVCVCVVCVVCCVMAQVTGQCPLLAVISFSLSPLLARHLSSFASLSLSLSIPHEWLTLNDCSSGNDVYSSFSLFLYSLSLSLSFLFSHPHQEWLATLSFLASWHKWKNKKVTWNYTSPHQRTHWLTHTYTHTHLHEAKFIEKVWDTCRGERKEKEKNSSFTSTSCKWIIGISVIIIGITEPEHSHWTQVSFAPQVQHATNKSLIFNYYYRSSWHLHQFINCILLSLQCVLIIIINIVIITLSLSLSLSLLS